MLNELLLSTQRSILLIDNGDLKSSNNILKNLLHENDEKDIIELQFNKSLKHTKTFELFLSECNSGHDDDPNYEGGKWNVLLPTLSDLLIYQPASMIFTFLHNLQTNPHVKRLFLWILPNHLMHSHVEYVLASLQHMSDLVLNFEHSQELIAYRKSGGKISKSNYQYERNKQKIHIQQKNTTTIKPAQDSSNAKTEEPASTFRLELDEDEMLTRNALALPFEKRECEGDKITYVPSAEDYDGEDLDEDLDI